MAEVKVLVEGYARNQGDIIFASSTVTLIRDSGKNIIFDPGMDKKLLMGALKKENLKENDIHFVILSHAHPDHTLLAGIFQNSRIVNNRRIYSFDGKIESQKGIVPGTKVRIISTAGHYCDECCAAVDTGKGKVVVAGDLFWWKQGDEQKSDMKSLINLQDPYMNDEKALKESRKKVLEIADFIIPGHGKMFKVEK